MTDTPKITALKAEVYDLLLARSKIEQRIKAVEQAIAKISQETNEK